MQQIRDVNTFRVEQIVSIPGVEDYEKVTIKRISDSGVTVNGPKCGNNIVISGRTPAQLFDPECLLETALELDKNGEKEIALNIKLKQKPIMTTENTNVETAPVEDANNNRAKRGSIKAKMDSLKIPQGSFTVKQFAELNDIPVVYANQWVKDNAKEDGSAAKIEGQRGRVAKLYKAN